MTPWQRPKRRQSASKADAHRLSAFAVSTIKAQVISIGSADARLLAALAVRDRPIASVSEAQAQISSDHGAVLLGIVSKSRWSRLLLPIESVCPHRTALTARSIFSRSARVEMRMSLASA
jgi:hypothetical protein